MATLFQFPYRTVAEVSLKALVKNLVTLRTLTRKEVIPVVKADAYGHGMIPVAKALVSRGSVQTLAVATLEEAIEIRKKFPSASESGVTILVLSGFLPHQADAYVKYRLIPVIHSLHHLKSLLGRTKLPEIHLKIDTGMNRLGLFPEEIETATRVIDKLNIKLSGLMTHFADSEVTTSPFIDEQIKKFEVIHSQMIEKKLLQTDAKIHVSNSGGIFRGKLSISTAIRPGIALFGVSPNPVWDPKNLVPALQWKTRVIALKNIKRGDTVGYNRTYKAAKKEKIAIIPVGYADGYPRALSNQGEVLILGKKATVRGVVSMDMIAIDCTHVSGVREGTEVTIIGQDSRLSINAWELADKAGTIAYEILCGISPRVPRIYYD